jgi:tetratricopeptide (TPR) repeat protein
MRLWLHQSRFRRKQAKIDAATGMPAAPADLQVPVQSLAETVTAPTPPEPPIPLPVAPPDRSRAMSASAPAPKTTPDKVLSAQQKKLAAEARNESMQANKMPIQMERSRPLDTRLNGEGESRIQRHEGVGLSIAVRTPRLDAAYELGQAYEALMGGDTVVAAAIYQRILDVQPRNVDALFGLATTYHRVGALEKAKPLYATLLAVAPDHRDGLNNFLMLLGEENPAEALARLKSLEAANRSYAPIPAQIAMIYERMGDMASAVDAMTRAVSRAPENVQYRYNLAVLLDKAGNWNDAASIYQDVLAAVDRGERVPSSRDDIQSRLRYLLTNHG